MARVIPFPGTVQEPPETVAPGPIVGAVVRPKGYLEPCVFCGAPLGDCPFECRGCRAAMHSECYWGRIAPLEDWIAYMRRVMETDDDFSPDVRCPACREEEA